MDPHASKPQPAASGMPDGAGRTSGVRGRASVLPIAGSLTVGLVVLATIMVVTLAGGPGGAPAPPTGVATPFALCDMPGVSLESGSNGGWRLVVEDEHSDASGLLFVSGTNEVLCLAARDARGRYTNAVSGIGRLKPLADSPLTYDTGLELPPTGAALRLLAGRVPAETATVLVTAADGASSTATIAAGYYLGWLPTRASIVSIRARDAGGREIAALEGAALAPS